MRQPLEHFGLSPSDCAAMELTPSWKAADQAKADERQASEGHAISRAEAEKRMLEKLTRSLTEDVGPVLPAGVLFSEADALAAFEHVWTKLIVQIKGDPWKMTDKVIEEQRDKRYPDLFSHLPPHWKHAGE